MRVIVLGATGMLGHQIWRAINAHPEFVALATVRSPHREVSGPLVCSGVDVLNSEALHAALNSARPDVIINCIGLTPRRHAANDESQLIQVNTLLPHQLKRWAEKNSARLVHFSTDCVFDGQNGPYTEESQPNARDMYGKSKALGEVQGTHILTLRSSIIGPELAGHTELFDWARAQANRSIRGYSKCLYSGVTTLAMSRLVCELLLKHPHLNGLYQVASTALSKFQLLSKINHGLNLNLKIQNDDTMVCDRRLNGEKFCQATGLRIPSWDQMISEMRNCVAHAVNEGTYAL